MRQEDGADAAGAGASGMPNRVLVLATTGFFLNFWAWSLIGPLGTAYRDDLGLTGVQQSVLVAVPVIVGSLGRIPVGALTDRYGARTMFPAVTVLTILPVLFVGLVAESYPALLVGGFFLGLGGTTFAIGVPAVNAWFPPARRGMALGLFGMGTGGTAIAAFTTVALAEARGRWFPFVLVAVVLAVYAVVSAVFLRDAPGRSAPQGSLVARVAAVVRLPMTVPLAFLYAISFGGFVAFSVYLPAYLRNAFGLEQSDAAFRTAVFVVLAVVARPVGGWLSDRFGPVIVLVTTFSGAGLLAVLAALELPLVPVRTVGFLGLAATLGAAAGAVFALVARVAPPDKVGGVTGVVGAAGGLGGFVPPLVMGAFYDTLGDYTPGLLLLAAMAFGCAAYTWGPVRRAAR